MPLVDISNTPRKAMTPSRALRIWEARNGICIICNEPIDGPRCEWIIEHPRALGLGGSDDDADLGPAHRACADEKTYGPDGDLARIAEAKRQKAAHLGIRRPKMQGRGFKPAPPQRNATRQIVHKFDRLYSETGQ